MEEKFVAIQLYIYVVITILQCDCVYVYQRVHKIGYTLEKIVAKTLKPPL